MSYYASLLIVYGLSILYMVIGYKIACSTLED
jgi:hypothetical protein